MRKCWVRKHRSVVVRLNYSWLGRKELRVDPRGSSYASEDDDAPAARSELARGFPHSAVPEGEERPITIYAANSTTDRDRRGQSVSSSVCEVCFGNSRILFGPSDVLSFAAFPEKPPGFRRDRECLFFLWILVLLFRMRIILFF
ncbi:hypothetical protein WA026_007191 [Henosepilachna vigintioctopunctata]|uniref:Uncharacterized protein n=1 Tax=Henosepilachna vigintioctopunctata TaxID=420089 RepID=A0AAW1V421_9CUCU